MKKKFRWGVIGLGKIAHKFVQDLDCSDDTVLEAVASNDIGRARAFAQQYEAARFFGAYADILAADIDAVYIATPHVSHCDLTVMCLEAGVPVLCEKPFAMNRAQVQRMVDASRRHNTFLMEAMWTRFLPTTTKLLDLVQSGTIGKLRMVQADFGYFAPYAPESRIYNAALGGGSLLDVGIYPAFLSLLLLGKPADIKASANIGPSGVDEACAAILQHEGGAMSVLHSAVNCKTPTTAVVYGELGFIKIHSRFHEPNQGLHVQLYNGATADFEFDWFSRGYHYEAEEVARCIRQGLTESPMMTHDFSLNLIGLLDDIRAQAGIRYPAD